MVVALTREVRVEDYPQWDAESAAGREEFNYLAYELHRAHPDVCRFVFTRGGEIVGEMYIRDELTELH
jgi:hypothetical protein